MKNLTIHKFLFAARYAAISHADQKRKYTGLPYVTHCLEVAMKLSEVTTDESSIVSAILHDVLEDTEMDYLDISLCFGVEVADLVKELTKPKKELGCSRQERARAEAERISKISDKAKVIKLADIIVNTKDIVERDLQFALIYLPEKEKVLELLSPELPLYVEAGLTIQRAYADLNNRLTEEKESE